MKRFIIAFSVIAALCACAIAQEPYTDDDMSAAATNADEGAGVSPALLAQSYSFGSSSQSIEEIQAMFEQARAMYQSGDIDGAYAMQQQAQMSLQDLMNSAQDKARLSRKLARDQRRFDRELKNINSRTISSVAMNQTTFFGEALHNMLGTLRESSVSWGDLGKDILMFLLILLAGAFLGWLIGSVVTRNLLRVLGFDTLADKLKISKFFEGGGLKDVPSTVVGNIIYWIVLFFAFSIAIGYMQGEGLAFRRITGLFQFLPRTFLAVFLIIIGVALGIFFSRIIKSIAINAGTREQLANVLGTLIMLFIVIFSIDSALKALNLSSQLIKNITDSVISYLMLGIAIALALGGRYMAGDFISYFKLIKAYPKGTELNIDGKKGVIKEIQMFYTIVYSEDGLINVPNHTLARKITVKEA